MTANALHPATYMPTKMVSTPMSSWRRASRRHCALVADPELDGVTGRYFNGVREAAPDPQADDPDARRQLRELSESLARAA